MAGRIIIGGGNFELISAVNICRSYTNEPRPIDYLHITLVDDKKCISDALQDDLTGLAEIVITFISDDHNIIKTVTGFVDKISCSNEFENIVELGFVVGESIKLEQKEGLK